MSSVQASERRQALRQLLRDPLVVGDLTPEIFRMIVRHRASLVSWFATHTGWTLSVERHGGFARLFKVPRTDDASHGANIGTKVFTVRHYTVLCLVLAALDECGLQITLTRLVVRLEELSADTPSVPDFDANQLAQRRVVVDVLRWLVGRGILTPRDGDAERYASGRDADAL